MAPKLGCRYEFFLCTKTDHGDADAGAFVEEETMVMGVSPPRGGAISDGHSRLGGGEHGASNLDQRGDGGAARKREMVAYEAFLG